jgi:hypothetical protein
VAALATQQTAPAWAEPAALFIFPTRTANDLATVYTDVDVFVGLNAYKQSALAWAAPAALFTFLTRTATDLATVYTDVDVFVGLNAYRQLKGYKGKARR